jgi:hypothetical protein
VPAHVGAGRLAAGDCAEPSARTLAPAARKTRNLFTTIPTSSKGDGGPSP